MCTGLSAGRMNLVKETYAPNKESETCNKVSRVREFHTRAPLSQSQNKIRGTRRTRGDKKRFNIHHFVKKKTYFHKKNC